MANSEECYFCGQRVYVLERISAEGKFFHRSCFTCHQCGATLRLGGYTFDPTTGEDQEPWTLVPMLSQDKSLMGIQVLILKVFEFIGA